MQVELSTSEIDALRKLHRNLAGSSDYVRVTCILMLSMGNSPSFVSECPGIDGSSVCRYRNACLHGGAGELLKNRHKGYWGLSGSRQLSVLRRELKRHIYTDAKSVSEWIYRSFGVRYTSQGTVDLLNRIGFTYKKTAEYAWIEKGEEFSRPTVSGRERVNINVMTVSMHNPQRPCMRRHLKSIWKPLKYTSYRTTPGITGTKSCRNG